MNVLSLFDGMSCGQVALERAGIKVDRYFASEIDKYAIEITQKNYPKTTQLGDVRFFDWKMLPRIDLIIAGSPCQGFSNAGKQLNFDDPRSKLFFDFHKLLRYLNPTYFLLENVKMAKKEWEQIITDHMKVEPIRINSKLVSAQNRDRLYWTNIPGVKQPIDKNIKLIDILDLDLKDCPIGVKVREKAKCVRVGGRNSPFGSKQEWDSPFQIISKKGKLKPRTEKSGCLTGGAHSGGNHSDMDILHTPFATRRYTTIECERLQTLPDNYTEGVSNSQRYKMLGNGWTVDVITHIFNQLPEWQKEGGKKN